MGRKIWGTSIELEMMDSTQPTERVRLISLQLRQSVEPEVPCQLVPKVAETRYRSRSVMGCV